MFVTPGEATDSTGEQYRGEPTGSRGTTGENGSGSRQTGGSDWASFRLCRPYFLSFATTVSARSTMRRLRSFTAVSVASFFSMSRFWWPDSIACRFAT